MSKRELAETPVLIVGAGATGLVMASELMRHGVESRIIDKLPAPADHSRALAIQARTLEVFEAMGLADEAVVAGHPIHGMNFFSGGKRIVHFGFDEMESRYNFILALPQNETERILTKHLATQGIPIERDVELVSIEQDAEHVTATLRVNNREERARYRFLIGCDGAHSSVRHCFAIPFEGGDYEERFILADVQIDWQMPDDEGYGYTSNDGLILFLPMGHGRYRLIAQPPDGAGQGEPTLDEVNRLIKTRGPKGATATEAHWTAHFNIHRRQARDYRVGHVFLAGDAAHIHSPAGGQGMNTGIQDAFNLAWKLAMVIKSEARESILDSYQIERHATAKAVLKSTDLMTRVVTLRNPIGRALRDWIAPIITAQEVVIQRVRRTIGELDVNYRRSPIVQDAGGSVLPRGIEAGDRAPDAEPIEIGGKKTRLYGALHRTGHTLLLFAGKEASIEDYERLAKIEWKLKTELGGKITAWVVIPDAKDPAMAGEGRSVMLDPELAAHRAYEAHAEGACIIRPDRYIGYRATSIDPGGIDAYLAKIFG